MQRVLLLGSTGSIGTSTLDVIGRLADRFEVVALTAGRNVDLLCDQVARFRPRCVCVHEDAAEEARARLKGDGVKGGEVRTYPEATFLIWRDPDTTSASPVIAWTEEVWTEGCGHRGVSRGACLAWM